MSQILISFFFPVMIKSQTSPMYILEIMMKFPQIGAGPSQIQQISIDSAAAIHDPLYSNFCKSGWSPQEFPLRIFSLHLHESSNG